MCELFAMSSRLPAAVSFSMHEFARRGGLEAPNRDGWGLGYYRDRAAQALREPGPASESPLAGFLERQEWSGQLLISHLRRARIGPRALCNTQPFERELGGRAHLFAHNGELPSFRELPLSGRFLPMGQTDSEHAFCYLLDQLRPLYDADDAPDVPSRLEVCVRVAAEFRERGVANFLYTDGDALFAHAHVRLDPARDDALVPGLYSLHRSGRDESQPIGGRALEVQTEHPDQEVSLLASVPLTREEWSVVPEGEVLVLRDGMLVSRAG